MSRTTDYDGSFSIAALRAAYARGVRPSDVVAAAYARIEAQRANPVWIELASRNATLERARALEDSGERAALPLWGIPFAVKDNIDVAGLATTAGCPEYAYTPERNAHAVQRLLDAGAICVGKTNLDQFATGLVGTRSPYGACRNPTDERYISGGSSSGSAVAVACEHVSFALGTDTAGSGRVPAAFNNIVGLKPTRGMLSTRGVVPACRSLDCVSIFAHDCDDAQSVLRVAAGYDPCDPYSRAAAETPGVPGAWFRFAIPGERDLEFHGDGEYRALFAASVERMKSLGGEPIEIDLAPFLEAQRLLYEGPWLAERLAAIGDFSRAHPDAVHGVVRAILERAASISAVETFKAAYRLAELRREAETVWQRAQLLLLPTAPTIYRIDEVQNDPLELNARLGRYTNFVNLLDLAAISVPAGARRDAIAFGVSLIAPAFSDEGLLHIGGRLHAALQMPTGALRRELPQPAPRPSLARDRVRLAVVGAHLSGMPLNAQLTEHGAQLVRRAHTAPRYRLFALPADEVARPGMIRVGAAERGAAIETEVWALPAQRFGDFVAAVPAPLCIGTVELEDGEQVAGFVCEPHALAGARDITRWGGWRAWVEHGRYAAEPAKNNSISGGSHETT